MATVKAGSPEHLEIIRAPLVAQIEQLTRSINDQKEALKYAEDARTSAREANAELKKQIDRLQAKADESDRLAAQVQGLQGYIDALRDAGMAPPPRDPYAAPVAPAPGTPWAPRR